MTGYHPFLAELNQLSHLELLDRYLVVFAPDWPLGTASAARRSRDSLSAALLDWADSTGLARGQGDFGFIMWAHGISAGVRRRYGGKDAA